MNSAKELTGSHEESVSSLLKIGCSQCIIAKLYEIRFEPARQKVLCKKRQASVKRTDANQGIARVGHSPA